MAGSGETSGADMRFKQKEKGKKLKTWLITLVCLVLIVPVAWVCFIKFEGEAPVIELSPLPAVVPARFDIKGKVHDARSGLKKIQITLSRNGKETVLLDKAYEAPAGWLEKGRVIDDAFKIPVSSAKNQFPDGKATLRLIARDYSWRDWWNGNKTIIEKEIVFDTKAPQLTILSSQHNVSQGGSGLVIYRLSEPCVKSGVMVGDDFFPGYAGHFSNKNIYLAFFAVPIDHTSEKGFYVTAADAAGNSAKNSFYYHLKKKTFRKDVLKLSDSFLNTKLLEFQDIPGFPAAKSSVDQFMFINTELRKKNNQVILGNGKKTDPQLYWEGAFGRMPNAAPRAGFADYRDYEHNGAIISHAVHMGVDLASTQHVEIPASNNGKIVFADYVGIYGNLVCIDHGYGLMSIYAHLNEMTVKPGDMVAKNDIIGYSGTTGMAGGDHLHFGMFIDHIFVNPIEWWDASWIANNITGKIKEVQASGNK